MKEKRGQEINITTIIIIILSVIALFIIVAAFTGGVGELWKKITGVKPAVTSLDLVIAGCKASCAAGAKDAYCNVQHTVEIGGKVGNYSCHSLQSQLPKELEECPGIGCS